MTQFAPPSFGLDDPIVESPSAAGTFGLGDPEDTIKAPFGIGTGISRSFIEAEARRRRGAKPLAMARAFRRGVAESAVGEVFTSAAFQDRLRFDEPRPEGFLERGAEIAGSMVEFINPITLYPAIFGEAAKVANDRLEETGDPASALGTGVIRALSTLALFKIVGQVAGKPLREGIGKLLRNGDIRGAAEILKAASIGLPAGVGIAELELVLDQVQRTLFGEQTFDQAFEQIRHSAPETALEGLFSAGLIMGGGALHASFRARADFRTRLREAKTPEEQQQVLESAQEFIRGHREARDFVKNATPETLRTLRKRFEGRTDHQSVAMRELIDKRLKGEPGADPPPAPRRYPPSELTSREGLIKFARDNPDLALKLSKRTIPSRKDMSRLTPSGMSMSESQRREMGDLLRSEVLPALRKEAQRGQEEREVREVRPAREGEQPPEERVGAEAGQPIRSVPRIPEAPAEARAEVAEVPREAPVEPPVPRGQEAKAKSKGKFQFEPTEPAPPTGKPGFAAVGRGRPTKPVQRPFITLDRTKSPDKGIESFFGRSNRLTRPRAKLQRVVNAIVVGIRERFFFLPHIPRIPEAAFARDAIRTMPEQRRAAREKAVADVESILTGDPSQRAALDVAGLDLLRRKVFVEDLLLEAERAEQEALATENVSEREAIRQRRLPRGVTKASLETERTRVDALIAKSPAVTDSLARREALWKEVSEDLARRGVISEEQAKNRHYVRHFVLEYMDAVRQRSGGVGRRFKAPFRPYSIQRRGTRKDISTDYLEVELRALGDIRADNAIQDLAEAIGKRYSKTAPARGGEVIPGFVEWQFKRGNVFFRAKTITESQIARLMEEGVVGTDPLLEEGGIPLSMMRDALIIGGKRKTFYIPEWLAAQLDDLPVSHKTNTIVSFTRPVVQLWKRWILRTNPIRFNKRNFLGDAERVNAAGRTRSFRRIPAAVRMMRTRKSPSKHPEAYERAIEFGVLGSSLWHEMGEARYRQEFEQYRDVKTLTDFQRVVDILKFPFAQASRLGQGIQDLTQAREDILRVAVYLDALDDVDLFRKDGTPIRHWVGKLAQQEIQELAKQDKYRAAAKVSRETIGDYGAFSPFENDTLRQGLMPFYSWMKINTNFWPRTVRGAIREGGPKAGSKAAALGLLGAARGVFRTARAANWFGRIMWAYAALYLWNNRDEESRKKEAALPAWMKIRPHVTLEKGIILEPTALSDFMEWFELEDIIPDLARWERGQISTSELGIALMKTEARAPVQRIINALNPFLKAPATALGFRTFPDPLDAVQFAEAFSDKAMAATVVEILGSDVRRFIDSAQGRRSLREVLSYYFSGSAWRPLTIEKLEAQITDRLKKATLKRRSRTTGRPAGQPKLGREREVQILRNRLDAIQEQDQR